MELSNAAVRKRGRLNFRPSVDLGLITKLLGDGKWHHDESRQPAAATARSDHSLDDDAHLLDHARIFGELRARQGVQFLGGAAADGKTQFLELLTNLWISERLQDLRIQPRNDLLGRAGRRQDREPGVEKEPRQAGFRDSRNIRK